MPTATWLPALGEEQAPLYEKILRALEQDMRSGALGPGARLPPQRELAYALGMSTGTITRAYAEGERLGLLRGHVGRGTFVADLSSPDDRGGALDQTVDLAVNVIPHQAAARRLAEGGFKRRYDYAEILAYAPPAGLVAHRRAAVTWLERTAGYAPEPDQMILTAGAQQAMSLVFNHLVDPGETVLCEEATFSGIKALSEQQGFRLKGVEMDGEGLVPDALDRSIRTSAARVLYAMPTVQNPTARSMSAARRADLVKVLQRTGVWLVEDDNYALFRPRRHQPSSPLAAELPQQSFYVGGVSKSVAPGLRTGFLVCPPGPHIEAIARAVRATVYSPATLGAHVFSQWVEDGTAFEIAENVRIDIAARSALAKSILELPDTTPDAPHLWLEMTELQAEKTFGRALRAGVLITPPAAPIAPGSQVGGVRICLGGPRTHGALESGLRALAGALAAETPAASNDVL